jgi:hypothetical protein
MRALVVSTDHLISTLRWRPRLLPYCADLGCRSLPFPLRQRIHEVGVTARWSHVVDKRRRDLLRAADSAAGSECRAACPYRKPKNICAERLIGSIRRDCLDHVVVFGEQHLRHLLSSYQKYCNELRTHLSPQKDAPIPRDDAPPPVPSEQFCSDKLLVARLNRSAGVDGDEGTACI